MDNQSCIVPFVYFVQLQQFKMGREEVSFGFTSPGGNELLRGRLCSISAAAAAVNLLLATTLHLTLTTFK